MTERMRAEMCHVEKIASTDAEHLRGPNKKLENGRKIMYFSIGDKYKCSESFQIQNSVNTKPVKLRKITLNYKKKEKET